MPSVLTGPRGDWERTAILGEMETTTGVEARIESRRERELIGKNAPSHNDRLANAAGSVSSLKQWAVKRPELFIKAKNESSTST